jgi:hypothetical protein
MSSELSEVETQHPAIPSEPAKPVTALETARRLAERLDRTVRTVDRYVELGILPSPLKIRGKRFWPAGTMPVFDKPGTAVSTPITRFWQQVRERA